MNKFITKVQIEKAVTDIQGLKIEAKKRGLESQLGRWIASYMSGLQKSNKEAHSAVLELIEMSEV